MEKEKKDIFSTTLSSSSPDIASNLRESQTSKYQCGKEGRTGHGYVAGAGCCHQKILLHQR